MRRGGREFGLVELNRYILILCAYPPANRSHLWLEGDAVMHKYEDADGKTSAQLRITQREFRPRSSVTMGAAGPLHLFQTQLVYRGCSFLKFSRWEIC